MHLGITADGSYVVVIREVVQCAFLNSERGAELVLSGPASKDLAHFDMVSHVASAQGWLLKLLFRIVGRLRLRFPCTPYVIELRCFFKDLSSFVVHAFQFGFPLRPDEHGDHRR